MSDETYNGWKNYPTWAVNLWLSNDEGLYHEISELVEIARSEENPRYAAGQEIKILVVDELAPDLGASFAADLLGYALDSVDWFEIADAWLEE